MLGHSQINLRQGSSIVDFFLSGFTEDNVGSVELDGYGVWDGNVGCWWK